MKEEAKLLADMLRFGTAVFTSDGKHVPYHDFYLSDDELEANRQAARHMPERST